MNPKEGRLVQAILHVYPLCPSCLARQFPSLPYSRLASRAEAVKGDCFICRGLMSSLEEVVTKVLEAIDGYEYDTFLVGATLPSDVVEREDALRARFKLKGGEAVKSALTRRLGRMVASRTGGRVSYRSPELSILVAPYEGRVEARSKPLYLFGRYVKMERGVPQKKRLCEACRGAGCRECGHTGLSKPPSVEERLSQLLLQHLKGREARFTWIGSEDTGSLVKGRGRPFYVEVRSPMARQLDAKRLLRRGDDAVVLKEVRVVASKPKVAVGFDVRARAHVNFEREPRDDELRKLEDAFEDRVVQMVSTKKKHRMLTKRVYGLEVRRVKGQEVQLLFRCEGGLNIRGLVAGEGAEVKPSIPDVLGFGVTLDGEKPFDILDVRVKGA